MQPNSTLYTSVIAHTAPNRSYFYLPQLHYPSIQMDNTVFIMVPLWKPVADPFAYRTFCSEQNRAGSCNQSRFRTGPAWGNVSISILSLWDMEATSQRTTFVMQCFSYYFLK